VSSNGATANGSPRSIDRLVTLGYITAVSIPPIGLILGIVLAIGSRRASSRHAPWVIAVSVAAAVVWVLVLASGALRTASTDY